ncbi:MAG TPA: hypothetical protein VIO36_08465 [Anaerolineaceae bacterium]
MNDLEPAARVVLYIFVGFIIALNLGLIFAFRDRNKIQPPRPQRKSVFKSRDEDAARELARRVAELRAQQTEKPGPRPGSGPDSQPPAAEG